MGIMKDKIFKEAIEWYENKNEISEVNIEDFVNLVINKTADNIIDRVKDELKNEFENGNLKHSFVISSDYYLDLKLKEIKQKYLKLTNEEKELEEIEE